MRIEYLIAWEDNTWTTEIHEVATEDAQDTEAHDHFGERLFQEPRFRKAVALFTFNTHPDY